MKRILAITLLFNVLVFQSNAQLGGLLDKAKKTVDKYVDGTDSLEKETGDALKEALNFGLESAVIQLSANKGYLESPYKILIPEDAQKIIDKIKHVPGFENVEKDLILKMNAAAELAANKATPIFVNAIKEMTIKDATTILLGDTDAATKYLESNTRTHLYSSFMPVIQESLDEVNARTYWRSVVKAYNNIPFVNQLNPELDDHVNNKGLDGLFELIQKKEEGIRQNQNQRTTDLLRKVFARQD